MHAGEAVREAGASLRTKRVQPRDSGPSVDVIVNDADGALNSTITPGGPVTVSDHYLAIRGEDPSVGVYIKPVTGRDPGGHGPRSRLIENQPSRLIFLAPAGLTAGEKVHLVLISQYIPGGDTSKTTALTNAPLPSRCPRVKG